MKKNLFGGHSSILNILEIMQKKKQNISKDTRKGEQLDNLKNQVRRGKIKSVNCRNYSTSISTLEEGIEM